MVLPAVNSMNLSSEHQSKWISAANNAWQDEMTMLRLAICILMPTAMLIVINFGLFVTAMNHFESVVVGVACIGFMCMGRAAMLRWKKLI